MTLDLDEIRAALAAEVGDPNWFQQRKVLRQNAPAWLASLISEVERLRAERVEVERYAVLRSSQLISEIERLRDQIGQLVFERDNAQILAERLYSAIDEGLGPSWWRGHCQAAKQAYEKRSWKGVTP